MRGQGRAEEGASRGASPWGSEARGPGAHRRGRGRGARGPEPRPPVRGSQPPSWCPVKNGYKFNLENIFVVIMSQAIMLPLSFTKNRKGKMK